MLNRNQFKYFQNVDGNVTVEHLRQFVRRESNVKISLSHCLKQFDIYAAKFVKALKYFQSSEAEQVQAIVRDAFDSMTKLHTDSVCQLNCIAFFAPPTTTTNHISLHCVLRFCFILGKTNCTILFAIDAAYTRTRFKFYWSGTDAIGAAIGWKNKRSKAKRNQSKAEYIGSIQFI